MIKAPENKACPACRAIGGDSTGDHLYRVMHPVTRKLLNYYRCRKCGHTENLLGNVVEEPAPMVVSKVALADVATYPHIADRGINREVRELYGVRTSVSSIGQLERHFYPMTRDGALVTYKFRDIAKKDFGRLKKGIGPDVDLFGMQSLKGTPRNILITEGEEDAMAAHQMLKGVSHNLACLSLPDGTGSGLKSIRHNLQWLQQADKVYLCPDQDEQGQQIVERIAALLPDVHILKDLSEKDANAMLLKKKHKDFANSFLRAQKYQPQFLIEIDESLIKESLTPPEYGRTWPWPTLQDKTYGMRDGEGIYVGAGVKIGKSEFINELVLHRILANDGDIPAVIKFEELPKVTMKKLAGKQDKTFYHRPDISFSIKDMEASMRKLKGKAYFYKAFGTATWDIVSNYIRYVAANGSKTIIIDPITKLTNHLSPSDTETELRRISNDLACMAQDLGFFYVVTCHLKAPPAAKTPHERGGRVESNQFRGSRAMMENCYMMLGIERNKDPDLSEDERNTSTFVLLEDRSFGNIVKFPVFYDKTTGDYLEPTVSMPHLGGTK